MTTLAYASHVSSPAAQWLRRFRFTGRVMCDPTDGHATAQRKIVSISSPLCELVVLGPPASMLIELVTINAAQWKATLDRAHPPQIHHEPTGEWPFDSWMDVVVAQHCGFPNLGEMGRISTLTSVDNLRGHASSVARRRPSTCRSHPSSWFQLVKMRILKVEFVDDQYARQFADRLLATRIITGFGVRAFVVAAAEIYRDGVPCGQPGA